MIEAFDFLQLVFLVFAVAGGGMAIIMIVGLTLFVRWEKRCDELEKNARAAWLNRMYPDEH